MTRSYSKIVAQHQRDFPHQVRLRNAGDWRDRYCSRMHYMVTAAALVIWFEGGRGGDRLWVYGFKAADQAAAFQRWADGCGINWSIRPQDDQRPRPPMPPERPETNERYTGHASAAVQRITSGDANRRHVGAHGGVELRCCAGQATADEGGADLRIREAGHRSV